MKLHAGVSFLIKAAASAVNGGAEPRALNL
jgi:hypothetical protein